MKVAVVAVVTDIEGEFFITLGEGDHSSERWKLSASLLKKIAREAVERVTR